MYRSARTTNRPDALVRIPADGIETEGMLNVSQSAKGVVLFAHGSGSTDITHRRQSGRHSARTE